LSGLSVTTEIRENVTGFLERLDDIEPLHPILARESERLTVRHLQGVNAQRSGNSGLGRSGFYAKAAQETTGRESDQGFEVAIRQLGFRLRVFGGTVVPVNGEWLTIPATSTTYNRRAADFDLYFRGRSDGQAAALVDVESDEVYFWLVRRTVHQADRSVLPSDEEFQAGWRDTMSDFFSRLVA